MSPGAIDQTKETIQPVLVTKSNSNKMESKTILEECSNICEVDIDTMDNSYANHIKGKPCDMTSNQFLMAAMLIDPKNEEIVNKVIKEKGNQGWKSVFCQCAVEFCKTVIDHIRGRVLVQVSPRGAYEYEDVLSWSREYSKCFESVGIPKSKFAIKIPTTGPAMNAALTLEKEGIRCLGTAMFSVHQAIAASQANCYAISPYFNEIKAHGQTELRLNCKDVLLQHPMSNRIAQIRYLYNLQNHQSPQMKPASFIEWQEVIACAMLGSENVTVLPPVLDQMIELKSTTEDGKQLFQRDPKSDLSKEVEILINSDPLANDPSKFSKEDLIKLLDVDFLANNGSALDAANEADKTTKQRLFDALELFCDFEDQCKTFIEGKIKSLNA